MKSLLSLKSIRWLVPVLLALTFSACAPLATVDDKDPVLPVAVPAQETPQLKVAPSPGGVGYAIGRVRPEGCHG